MLLVCNIGYQRSLRSELPLEALADLPMVDFPSGSARCQTDEAFNAIGVQHNVRFMPSGRRRRRRQPELLLNC